MFETKDVVKVKTPILCPVTFAQNRVVREIMWKNMAQPDRPHILSMRIACWISKVTDTHNRNVKYLLFF
jgi:hypothetical protein